MARTKAVPQETPTADRDDVAVPTEGAQLVDEQGERREVETCHVWVDSVHAGILMSWWKPTTVWFGEVAWTPPDQPRAVALEWIEASRLRQG